MPNAGTSLNTTVLGARNEGLLFGLQANKTLNLFYFLSYYFAELRIASFVFHFGAHPSDFNLVTTS